MVVISIYLTPVATHTLIVEPQTTLHAGCGEAGEVEVNPTSRTVWILWEGQGIHISKEVTSLICAGHSREGYGSVQGWGGHALSLGGLLSGGGVAWAGHSCSYGGLGGGG